MRLDLAVSDWRRLSLSRVSSFLCLPPSLSRRCIFSRRTAWPPSSNARSCAEGSAMGARALSRLLPPHPSRSDLLRRGCKRFQIQLSTIVRIDQGLLRPLAVAQARSPARSQEKREATGLPRAVPANGTEIRNCARLFPCRLTPLGIRHWLRPSSLPMRRDAAAAGRRAFHSSDDPPGSGR